MPKKLKNIDPLGPLDAVTRVLVGIITVGRVMSRAAVMHSDLEGTV